MRKIATVLFIIIALTGIDVYASEQKVSPQEEFFQKMLPLAIYYQDTAGILVSLNLGQSALETEYGKYLCDSNNYYGHTVVTNGKTRLKKYDSMEESMADYVQNLSSPRYDAVRLADNYKDACYAIKACGYAADPYYAEKVISVIEKYELYKYDQHNPPTITVTRGDRGERVELVQRMLDDLGYDLGECGVDGVYGDQTQRAVRRFQWDNKLTNTGIVNNETMKRLTYMTKLKEKAV